MDNLRLHRLGIIKNQVVVSIDRGKELLLNKHETNFEELNSTAQKLKTKTRRFTSEMNEYMKDGVMTQETVEEFTMLQLEADIIVDELETNAKLKTCNIIQNARESNVNIASKLPRLELPTFNGNILKWHEFWDAFSSSVDSQNINKVDKLAYLKRSLVGRAKETIEGLDTTERNYDIAVKILKETYGKSGVVIDAHYKELYNMKRKDDSIKEARRIFNETEMHLRILSSLGEDVLGSHLRSLIIEKFPHSIQYELKKMLKEDIASIEDIRKNLSHIITAREGTSDPGEFENNEAIQRFTTESLIATSTENINYKRKFLKPTSNRRYFNNVRQPRNPHFNPQFSFRKRKNENEHHTMLAVKRPKRRHRCIFCMGSHFNEDCDKITSVQERRQKLDQRCFVCFGKNHKAQECRVNKKCAHCGRKHNRAICPIRKETKSNNRSIIIPEKEEHEKQETNLLHTKDNKNLQRTLLQTAIITVRNSKCHEQCRILLDSGSQRTYISERLSKRLNMQPIEENSLLVYTFGSQEPKEIKSTVVEFDIITKKNFQWKIKANTTQYITSKIPVPRIPGIDNLADDGSHGEDIDILIGNDYYHLFMGNEKRKITDHLFIINSDFGWIASGMYYENKCEREPTLSVVTYFQGDLIVNYNEPDLPLKGNDYKQLWELEAIGIHDSPKSSREEEAVKKFNETVKYNNNRYEVKWPWIEYPPNLPTNFGLALGRLESMIKRLDSKTKENYKEILQQQLELGIIEKVPDTQPKPNHPVHYLAHHCVIKQDKTTVHRVVYDGSAKLRDACSLNECLYKGPLLLQDLTSLLLRFRTHNIAITADIEKAFLQISLQTEDRDVTRFLWLKDDNSLTTLRFCRVPFGVISSPFLLAATIKHHLNKTKSEISKQIDEDLYVDNLITGTKTIKEAKELYNKSREIFQKASMNLRQWNSNNKEFIASLPKDQQENKEKTNVLGLLWNTENDTLSLNVSQKDYNNTEDDIEKKQVLRVMASIYDPCGFIAPIVLPLKILFQQTWIEKLKWEDKLPTHMKEKWKNWLEDINTAKNLTIPRSYFKIHNQQPNDKIQLHCFTDASQAAYAAVVYLKRIHEHRVEVSFVMGKCRLTPKKDQDNLKIPKLELLGALIGSRLIQYAEKALKLNVEDQYLWTDSQIVLSWINSNKLLPPFISRRICEIKQNKQLKFKYVNTKENPADIATRLEQTQNLQIWINGPQFLQELQSKWPQPEYENVLLTGEAEDLTKKIQSDDIQSKAIPHLNIEVTNEQNTDEEIKLIKEIQNEHFPEEVAGKMTNLAKSLDLIKDNNGLLRCRGRLGNTIWQIQQKYPILLPKNNEFTFKVIEEIHKHNYHVGVSHCLALVRNKYWVTSGRSQVQKVLRKCTTCKKYEGGPYKLPEMPPLPEERVRLCPPFTYTGIDYFGPLTVKNESTFNKRWICLFTCLAVRAIHLEVVQNLTADECLQAIRRFIATRGLPILMTSDNAKYFKLTAEVMSNNYCIKNEIKWRFIPELAPWFGGFYERLIGLTKRCLMKTVEKHILSDTQLNTTIKEIEAVINTRPLTFVDTEPEHILTPSDFLRIGGPVTTEENDTPFLEPATSTKDSLIEGWKRGQTILKEFSCMFNNQYLMSLREKSGGHKEPRIKCNVIPKKGDKVQIKAESSRVHWKAGTIMEVIKGKDGKVRVAKVITPTGEIFTRSIAHLYPLEITEDNFGEQNKTTQPYKNSEDTEIRDILPPPVNKPGMSILKNDITINENDNRKKRLSAQRAQEVIKRWTNLLLTNEHY